MNLLANTKITRVFDAAGAGTGTVQSGVIDMAEFDGCTFVLLLGDVTSACELELVIQMGDESNGSDAVDVEDATTTFTAGASDADDMILAVEIARPQKQYVRAKLVRAVQNAVIDGGIAIQSSPKLGPTTHDATTVLGTAFGLSPDSE